MWWSEDEWAALTDPTTCGMCADAHVNEDEHSLLVAPTATAHVRLSRNQAHPDYCVVIFREHVTDLADLEPDQLTSDGPTFLSPAVAREAVQSLRRAWNEQ